MNEQRIAWHGRLTLAVLLLTIATGCALCERDTKGKGKAASATFGQLVPADVDAAFFTADLKEIRGGLQVIDRTFGKQMPVDAMLGGLKTQFGIDPRDVPGMKQKGIRTSSGLGVVLRQKSAVLLVPVESATAFENYLTSVARDRFGGAEQPQSHQAQELTLKVAVTKEGAKSIMAWCIKDGVALIYPGKLMGANEGDPQVSLTAHLTAAKARALAGEADFKTLQERLTTQGYPIFGVVNLPTLVGRRADELGEYIHSKDAAESYRKLAKDLGLAGLGLKVEDKGAQLQLHMLARGEAHKRAEATARALAAGDALAPTLAGEPAFGLKLAINPEKSLDELRKLMGDDMMLLQSALETLKKNFKLDLEQTLKASLDGNIIMATYDFPAILLRRTSMATLMTKTRTSFSMGLKDRAALITALDQVVANAGGFVKREDDGQVAIFVFADDEPLATLAVGQKVAVLGSTRIERAELLKLVKGQGAGPKGVLASAPAADLLGGDTHSGIFLDPSIIQRNMGSMIPAGQIDMVGPIVFKAHNEPTGPTLMLDVVFNPPAAGTPTQDQKQK